MGGSCPDQRYRSTGLGEPRGDGGSAAEPPPPPLPPPPRSPPTPSIDSRRPGAACTALDSQPSQRGSYRASYQPFAAAAAPPSRPDGPPVGDGGCAAPLACAAPLSCARKKGAALEGCGLPGDAGDCREPKAGPESRRVSGAPRGCR